MEGQIIGIHFGSVGALLMRGGLNTAKIYLFSYTQKKIQYEKYKLKCCIMKNESLSIIVSSVQCKQSFTQYKNLLTNKHTSLTDGNTNK